VPTRLRPAKRRATFSPAAAGKQDFPALDRTFLFQRLGPGCSGAEQPRERPPVVLRLLDRCAQRPAIHRIQADPPPSLPAGPGGADMQMMVRPRRGRIGSATALNNGASDLLEAFDVTAPSVSYHLKILRERG
jgi:hypothetical protein